jgi:hypothetical protein
MNHRLAQLGAHAFRIVVLNFVDNVIITQKALNFECIRNKE